MICYIHTEIRHAYEMSHGSTAEARDWKQLLERYLGQMSKHIDEGMSVIILYRQCSVVNSPNQSETAIAIRNTEEFEIYKTILGADVSSLRDQIFAAQVSKALAETNFSQGGQVIRPVLEGRRPANEGISD